MREGPRHGLGRAASLPALTSREPKSNPRFIWSHEAKPNRSTVSCAITEGFRLGRDAQVSSSPPHQSQDLHTTASANKGSQNIPLECCAQERQSKGLGLSPASTEARREGCSGQTQKVPVSLTACPSSQSALWRDLQLHPGIQLKGRCRATHLLHLHPKQAVPCPQEDSLCSATRHAAVTCFS